MVSTMEDRRKLLALKLYQISGETKISIRKIWNTKIMFLHFTAFKFGEFTLKSGELSPVYFDLRVIVSYPEVMDQLTDLMLAFIQDKGIQCDQLCGVPYTGEIETLCSRGRKQF